MDDEGKAVDALEAVRIDDARLELEARDDLKIVVLEDVVGGLLGRRDDHGIEEARVQHVLEQHRRAVDHEVDALFLELRNTPVVDGGRDDGLARQFFCTEVVHFVHRRDDHRRLLQRTAEHELRPLLDGSGGHYTRRCPVEHVVRAAGVELEHVERRQHLRHSELQQEIGELEVVRVLRHGQRQLVVGPPRKEQHVGVVEIVTQLGLNVTQSPFLQDVAEPTASRNRSARHCISQARTILFDVASRPDRIAVLHDAEPDGVGTLPPVLQQLQGLCHASVRAEAAHIELRPHEPGAKFEILIACTHADADYFFHSIPADRSRLGGDASRPAEDTRVAGISETREKAKGGAADWRPSTQIVRRCRCLAVHETRLCLI